MTKLVLKSIASILMLISISGCSSLKVSSDFDSEFDMKTLKQFYIISSKAKFKDTLTINRINKAISHELSLKNYIQSSKKDADFLVYYHINVRNKTQIVTDYQSIGMYPYRYRGMMVPTTRTYNYDEGQLIIDMIDPKNSNIIYRMSVKDQLKNFDNPKERTKYINEVIKQVLKDFPKKSI
jgi:hypothetical protein